MAGAAATILNVRVRNEMRYGCCEHRGRGRMVP